MSTGKCSSCLPAATSFDAAMIASASFSSSLPSSQVGLRAGGLQMAEGVDHRRGHGLVGDGKVVDGAGGRCAVQRVGRHLHLAHRVAFGAKLAHDWQNREFSR